MTAFNDRRHRIQSHPVPAVINAIENTVYGKDNKQIMYDLFIDNYTYEATAYRNNLSVRGLYKRVGTVADKVEKYLN